MGTNLRDRIVSVKFTEHEYREINQVAKSKGLPFSTFLRFCVLSDVRQISNNLVEQKGIKFTKKREDF